MEYPVWHLTGINSGMLIAVVAVLHVFIAQFAVGGGIYLVWMERRAYKSGSPEMLEWLERHTRFFLLVTMVFGGLSGVGIWFTISVVNPEATSMLIHNFVFFWAAEWAFFLLEVLSLLAYYHTYPLARQGRMSHGAHLGIGIVYAAAGYLSLVIINGIITFMLTPGQGLVTGNIWQGFFNPTYFPSMVARTGICLILAGMFALITAPRIAGSEARRLAVRASGLWIILPLTLLLTGSAWYFLALPPTRHVAVLRRTVDIQPFLVSYGWVLPLIFLAGIAAFVRAERLRRPLALVILLSGLVMVGSFEWVRETARRPWIAENYMYSNGMTVRQEERANAEGVAEISGWLALLRAHEKGAAPLPEPVSADLSGGSLIFAQQCATCHGLGSPRMDVVPRVRRLTRDGLAAQLRGEGKRLDYMPTFAGNGEDREELINFLTSRVAAEASARPDRVAPANSSPEAK